MSGSGRRLTTVGIVGALLLGVLLHLGSLDTGAGADAGGHGQRSLAFAVNAVPVGGVPAALDVRWRSGPELGPAVRWSKPALLRLLLGLLLGAHAALWWYLARPDRRFGPPLGRSPLAALRAPPALSFA
jgi:hypothetical protein